MVGSAWTPWLRPTVSVSLCSSARVFERGKQPIDIGDEQVRSLDQLKVEAGVEHVGRGHALVQEARLGPTSSETEVRKAMTSCFTSRSIASMRAMSKAPRFFTASGTDFGIEPELGHGLGGKCLDLEPDAELGLRLPDASHFGAAIAGDHASRPFPAMAQVS